MKKNNVKSYLINEKLTDSEFVDQTELLANVSSDSSIHYTLTCINKREKDSVPDGFPAIPITDTSIYNNQPGECIRSSD